MQEGVDAFLQKDVPHALLTEGKGAALLLKLNSYGSVGTAITLGWSRCSNLPVEGTDLPMPPLRKRDGRGRPPLQRYQGVLTPRPRRARPQLLPVFHLLG